MLKFVATFFFLKEDFFFVVLGRREGVIKQDAIFFFEVELVF